MKKTSSLRRAGPTQIAGMVLLATGMLQMSAAWADTRTEGRVLHQFSPAETAVSNSGALFAASDGNVYGVRSHGGANSSGELFRIDAAGNQARLFSFASTSGGSTTPRHPSALTEGSDGMLYIGAQDSSGGSVILKSTKGGSISLHATAPDSVDPYGIQFLIQGADGSLYGVGVVGYRSNGNAANYNQVFKVTSAGTWTQLHGYEPEQFPGSSGAQPMLVPAADGKLYGVSYGGGPASAGSDAEGFIFSVTGSGTFTPEFTFRESTDPAYGSLPVSLALGADQQLYGLTAQGGWPDGHNLVGGTFFRFVPGSAPQVLYTIGADGILPPRPSGRMLRGPDGRFYIDQGTASNEIARIDTSGNVDILHPGYLASTFDDSTVLGSAILGAAVNTNGLHVLTRYDSKSMTGSGRVSLLAPEYAGADMTFTLGAASVQEGQDATLSWNTSASSCAADGLGSWRFDKSGSGSESLTADLGSSGSPGSFTPPPRTWVLGLACLFGTNRIVTASRSLQVVAGSGGSGGGTGGGTAGDAAALTRGVARAVSGAEDSQSAFYIDVPAGATNLTFTTSGGSGDVDLYVRFGQPATTTTASCGSESVSNAESCTVAAPSAGRYYAMLLGYEAFSGVSLVASYSTSSGSGGSGSEPPDDDPGNSGGGGGMDALLLLLLAALGLAKSRMAALVRRSVLVRHHPVSG